MFQIRKKSRRQGGGGGVIFIQNLVTKPERKINLGDERVGDYIGINLRGYGVASAVSIDGLLTTSCGHKYEAWSSV